MKWKGIYVFRTQKDSLIKNPKKDITCPLFLRRGSLTVEAALVLPLFLLSSLTLLSFVDVMRITMENQMQQQKRLRSNAVYASVLTDAVEGRKGDYITLDYVYSVKLPVGGFGLKKVLVRQRSMVHIFNGYDDSYGDCVGAMPEYVYVTSGGSVYHKKRSCRALQISVREVSGAEVGNMRNEDRKKYRSCNICMKGYTQEEIRGQTVYITDYGVRYHIRPNCPDLTRMVQVVRIEDTGGKPACKFCN